MNDEISIVLKAKDEASKVVEEMGQKTKASFADLGKQVSGAMAVAGGAITLFLGSTLSGASDAEKANKMLANAVLNVTKASQEELDATSKLADELERKGVLDGDNIKVGLAQLSTFGLSNKAVRELGGSLADLAVNQFGVNASGEQLEQTANTVAKALNGQFGVLEKSGIRFTEAQKHIIETGTEMEKVKAINEGLAQNLKYTNDVALTTFEGGMAKLKVQTDNVKEAIGGALMPILSDMATKLMPIIQNVQDWVAKNPELFEQIVKIVAVVGGLLTVVGALGLILPPLIAGFTALISPVGLIMVAIVALGVAVYMLVQNWEHIKAKTFEIWNGISTYFSGLLSSIKNTFSNTWNSIKNDFEGQMLAIKTKISEVWTGILAFFSAIGEGIKTAITATWNGIKDFFIAFWEVLKTIFIFAVQLIAGIVILAFQAMGIDIVAVFQNISTFISMTFNVIKDKVVEVFQAISAVVTEALSFLYTQVQERLELIKIFINTIANFIGDIFSAVCSKIQKAWTVAWNAIVAFLTPIFKVLKETIGIGLNFINEMFTGASNTISLAWGNLWKGIGNVLVTVWDGVKSTITSSINWILEKVNTVIRALNSVVSKGAGVFGGSAISIPTIPLLANGGIVTSPTLAMIGEGNEPEAVIPLSRLGSLAGAGGGITVNINGGYYLSEDVARDLGGKIIDMLKLNRKL